MSEPTIHALGWTLLHFLWQGTAVAVLLYAARTVARSSQVRHALGVGALAMCVLLPIATFLLALPSTPAIEIPGAPRSVPISATEPGLMPLGFMSLPVTSTDLTRADLSLGMESLEGVAAISMASLRSYVPMIVLLWIAGVVLMTTRLAGSCWTTHRLRRVGLSPLPESWQARVSELAHELGLRRSVEVMVSSVAAVPMVVGVLRPIVLIPVATLLGLTPAQLEAILVHELEHVRRFDGLIILLQRLVETALFYHPAVWWISASVDREREHCCDDVVAARTDRRLYAQALATLEELRTPALAAAATDGPLLARVRRLLTPPAVSARITLSNVIGTFALVALTLVILGTTRSSSATAEDTMSKQLPGILLEDVRVPTHSDFAGEQMLPGSWSGTSMDGHGSFSSLVDSYVAALGAAGDEWSAARVAATFGHPFHFAMVEGAAWHPHNCNIDYWQFFDRMADLGWTTPGAYLHTGTDTEPDEEALAAAQEQAWEAVMASIDRGIPAIAISPTADLDWDYGLLVGYDAASKSYHVSHVQTDSIYTIPFDGFGRVWFNVFAFTERTTADPRAAEITTLRRAVEFSKGLRYTLEESKNCCEVAATGLDAYQLWLDVLDGGEFEGSAAKSHAWQLMHTRQLAAEYTREAAGRFEGAVSARLIRASEHYVQASELSQQLLEIVEDWGGESPPATEVEEARRLLDLVMQWERGAIMYLEVALLHLGEQIPGDPTNPGVAMLQQEPTVKIGVDVVPTEPHRGTTLASSLAPVMQTLGETGWTPARIQGVLGHLFHFQMAEGGGDVFHDNLDWSLGLTVLQEVAEYRIYEATKEASEEDRATVMNDARDAVRVSLERGIPAMVWSPRSVEQREQHHPGGHGACWGIIVGYDEAQETYSIRHPFVWQGDYSVRYDEIAEVDPAMFWFNVMVFDGAKSADNKALHRMALMNAISFADGTRLGEHKWTQGFAAYEQWLEAFESPDLPSITHHHANMLTYKREFAAEYLRDLSGIFADAVVPLAAAADHYEGEHAILEEFRSLADVGRAGGYSDEDRAELGRLLRGALEEERAAVANIEAALKLMDGS
jgi:beta-lactamase regulating signal transducer with metallopeptidase domain